MKLKFFELAKKLSKKSNYTEHQLGSVIVRRNNIEGVGWNSSKTHPRSPTRYQRIHAEFSALLSTGREDLTGCDIYVYREVKNGQIANARCCVDCIKMLKQVGIKRMFYTSETGYKMEYL